MAKFVCIEPVEFDHVRYEVGSEITLPDSAVPQLLELRAIEPVVARKAKAAAPPAEPQKEG